MKWILVANRAQALVYQANEKKQLEQNTILENENGRLKNNEIYTDSPGMGRARNKDSTHFHSQNGERDAHEQHAIRFAQKLAEFVDKARKQNKLEDLIVVAEPHFLGLLRSNMSKNSVEMVSQWVKKDFMNIPSAEMQKLLYSIL